MAKLKNIGISAADIREYLNTYSDFSFEVKTKKELVSLGFHCQHGGTYEDPITGKSREFDIRAIKNYEDSKSFIYRLCLSVECKNIRANYPLVLHCSPRTEGESYQDLIWSRIAKGGIAVQLFDRAFPCGLPGDDSVYRVQDPVGKSCDQVGRRDDNKGEVLSSDGDVFEKISQAINSSYDLIRSSHYAGDEEVTVVSNVVPVLVVPDGRLWTVWYDNSGEIVEGPAPVSAASYYIGKKWSVKGRNNTQHYRLSHLEIVELGGLSELIKKQTDPDKFSSKVLRTNVSKRRD